MGLGILVITLIAVIIVIILFLRFRAMRRIEKQVIVSALIDIYPSGSHHVEFVPMENVHPVDIVQLAISYIANVIFVTALDNTELKQSLDELIQFTVKHESLSDEVQFRKELNELSKQPPDSLLSSGKYATGKSERYQVRLIRGNRMDYSLSKFSLQGYKPNLATSTMFLYSAVANRLDTSYLKLLHKSLIGLISYFQNEKPTLSNNQAIAFTAVEYVLKVFPESIENSPQRVYRKNSDTHQFKLIESRNNKLAPPISHRVQFENLLGGFEQHIRQVRLYLVETDSVQPVNVFEGGLQKILEFIPI